MKIEYGVNLTVVIAMVFLHLDCYAFCLTNKGQTSSSFKTARFNET